MAAELRKLERGESVNCVAVLEEILSDAKAGKVVAVGVAAIMENGGVTRMSAGDSSDKSMVHLLGGVHLLAQFIQNKILGLGG